MNPKTKFVALLLFYVGLVLAVPTFSYKSDAGRYIYFAKNLSQGFYSPREMPNLTNGPGYPLVLLPIAAMDLSWLTGKLFNAAFIFLAVLYFHATLSMYVEARLAFWASLLLGLYPPILLYVPLIATEVLTFFLIAGFVYHFCQTHHDGQGTTIHLILAALYLGYLALTKIFFGYVLTAGLIASIGLYLWTKRNAFRKTGWVCCGALVLCLPYLLYTYSLTGRVFYWGSSGGESLYWASTPHENEYGDYLGQGSLQLPEVAKNHGEFFRDLEGLSHVDQDLKYRERVVSNIRTHPVKYLKNRLFSIGRMVFSYPYSYTDQKPSTFFYILPNMFLVVLSFLCLYPFWARWNQMPFEIHSLLCFFLISFGASTLVGGDPRLFAVLVPLLGLWIVFVLGRLVRVQLREPETGPLKT